MENFRSTLLQGTQAFFKCAGEIHQFKIIQLTVSQ